MNSMRKVRVERAILVATGLAVLLQLAGMSAVSDAADCGAQATSLDSPSPDCVSLVSDGEGGTVLAGSGSQDTPAFFLPPGGNTIRWTATASGADPVNFAVFVKPLDPNQPGWIFVANVILSPNETRSGSVDVSAGAVGAYYLTTIGASTWSVNISRAQLPALVSDGARARGVSVTPGLVLLRVTSPPGPTLATVPGPAGRRSFTPLPTRTPRPTRTPPPTPNVP